MSISHSIFNFFGVLCALIYLILPLPEASIFSLDPLVLLFIIGAFLNLKNPPSLFFAWCLGLMHDSLVGSLLGEHAFALTLTAYMALKILRRMRFFSLWQQVFCVGGLTLFNQLLIALIEGAQGQYSNVYVIVSPMIMNMAMWVLLGFLIFKHQDI